MNDFEKLYAKALRFLSYRVRSEKEVRDNLLKPKSRGSRNSRESLPAGRQVDGGVVEQVIEKLKEQKFINDSEFARMWIESRIRAKPRALWVIKQELKQKGIIGDDIEFPESTDIELAKKLVEKKLSRYKNLPEDELKIKLGRLLASKGFNWDTIQKALASRESTN